MNRHKVTIVAVSLSHGALEKFVLLLKAVALANIMLHPA
jgi:hypothetical protein